MPARRFAVGNGLIFVKCQSMSRAGVGRRATPRLAGLFQQFLAVELCVTALDALRVLLLLALDAPGTATDATNASRTLLLNLHTGQWDDELCRFFGVPRALLPEVRPSAADFGATTGLGFLPDGLPITGVAGDQQAALFGQCAFAAGEAKCTYGTGAFFLQHIGDRPTRSRPRLLTTLAAGGEGPRQSALEVRVFVAAAEGPWL